MPSENGNRIVRKVNVRRSKYAEVRIWHMVIIAILLSLVAALLWYWLVPWYSLACVGSISMSVFGVWFVGQSHFGWMDRVFFENLAISFSISASISVAVGVVYQLRRRR